ncbi:MAG: hypothetical protein LBG69_02955 [Zoogloeaceae bacterium]|jgi:hypothetical protein|nr:hypothetical protein [Zoogloeaceae bacterium]
MATYLIDYENIYKNGSSKIPELTADDCVIIFCAKGTKISVGDCGFLHHSPIKLQLKVMDNKKKVKNYLDFQLASCLGSLVERGEENFYIISNDNSYGAVIDYWKLNRASVNIERIGVEHVKAAAAKLPTSSAPKRDDAIKKKIRALVKDEKLAANQYADVYNLFLNEKETQGFYIGLVREFKQKQGSSLYKLLKNAFEEYKKYGTESERS